MKWFDKWLIRKFQTVWQHRDEIGTIAIEGSGKPVSLGILAQEEAWEDGLRITIKRMIGG